MNPKHRNVAGMIPRRSSPVSIQQDIENFESYIDGVLDNNNIRFKLGGLPFNPKLMKPLFTEDAINIHYQHHVNYNNTLNDLIHGTEYAIYDLNELVLSDNNKIKHNASQIINHNIFWNSITPYSSTVNDMDAILRESFSDFNSMFVNSCMSCIASGWFWLCFEDGILKQRITRDTETVKNPVLCVDLWEHSYYVDYLYNKEKYVRTILDFLNWDFALESIRTYKNEER